MLYKLPMLPGADAFALLHGDMRNAAQPRLEPITQNDEAYYCRDICGYGADYQRAGCDLFDSVAHDLATSITVA